MENLSRHDIPENIKNVINVAIEQKVVDVFDVYVLATECRNNFEKLVDELIEYAYSWIHVDGLKHKKVVEAAEIIWKERTNQGL